MSIFQYPNISIVQRLSREVCQYFTISTFQRFSKERCRASTVSSFHPCLSFRPVDIHPMLASIQKWKYQIPVHTYARLPRDHFTSMCNKVKHLQVFSQLVTHQMISVMAIWVSVMIIQLAPGYKRETWYSKYIAVPRLSVDRRLRVVLDVLDDQCKEPMVNIKDHLVGQLTMVQQCTLVLQLFVLSRTQSY